VAITTAGVLAGCGVIACGRSGPAQERPEASRSEPGTPASAAASAGAANAGGANAAAGGGGAAAGEGAAAQGASPVAAPPAAARAWTAGITQVERTGEPAQLADVRAARNEGYDRVVFELRGAVPGYHIEYVDSPVRDCGAGDVRAIAGDGWLEVRLFPAVAHTEAGVPTIAERERALTLPILRELELTCDFEAVVTWVIGVGSPHRYSVLELTDPPRLVVDVEH
jgi:hypothetical protein